MAEELELPLGFFILDGVEKRPVIGCPDDRANPFRLVGQHLAGPQVFNVQRVLAKSRGVGGIGQQVAIIGDGEGAQGHERLAGRQLVHIEHDLFGRIDRTALAAAVDGILRTLLRASVVEIIPRRETAPRHRSL